MRPTQRGSRELLPLPGAARRDIYGSVKSLEEACVATTHRSTCADEGALSPSPTGDRRGEELFTKRDVRTAAFDLDGDEYDFYDALTRYVEDQ